MHFRYRPGQKLPGGAGEVAPVPRNGKRLHLPCVCSIARASFVVGCHAGSAELRTPHVALFLPVVDFPCFLRPFETFPSPDVGSVTEPTPKQLRVENCIGVVKACRSVDADEVLLESLV